MIRARIFNPSAGSAMIDQTHKYSSFQLYKTVFCINLAYERLTGASRCYKIIVAKLQVALKCLSRG
jgi:hypothetical protein